MQHVMSEGASLGSVDLSQTRSKGHFQVLVAVMKFISGHSTSDVQGASFHWPKTLPLDPNNLCRCMYAQGVSFIAHNASAFHNDQHPHAYVPQTQGPGILRSHHERHLSRKATPETTSIF